MNERLKKAVGEFDKGNIRHFIDYFDDEYEYHTSASLLSRWWGDVTSDGYLINEAYFHSLDDPHDTYVTSDGEFSPNEAFSHTLDDPHVTYMIVFRDEEVIHLHHLCPENAIVNILLHESDNVLNLLDDPLYY